MGPLDQLDNEVIRLKTLVFATNTRKSYSTALLCYLKFCTEYGLPALPATPTNIGRYIAYLNLSKSPTSTAQYLTVIRLLHLECGLDHPFQDNHHVSSLLKAIKRDKGCEQNYKLTLTTKDLSAILYHLDLGRPLDAQLWSLILACFYGLLRISNVTVPNVSNMDSHKSITRQDIEFHANGIILNIRWSKTLQFRERVLQTALPALENDLCPTRAFLNFIKLAGPVPPNAPAWAFIDPLGQLRVPTSASVRTRLQSVFAAVGMSTKHFNTHSLRRSGASYLLAAKVPLETIKVLGDWKSDSVFKYLKPQPAQRLDMVNNSFTQSNT